MRKTRIGQGFAGEATVAAQVDVVVGDMEGPLGSAWAAALATPSAGHAPFVVQARPGLPARPFTLFVPKATIAAGDHTVLTMGAAQAGVAAGVLGAVRQGVLMRSEVEECVIVAAVWVDPAASVADAAAIATNNEAATLTAIYGAAAGRPTVDEVLGDTGGVWNQFFHQG